jgi:tetratricopeptide (TPR) repeat protein
MDSAAMMYAQSAKAYSAVADSVREADDYVYQGTAMMWAGDTTGGVAMWKAIVDKFPDSCVVTYNLARSLYSMQRFNDVIDLVNHRLSVCTYDKTNSYLLIGSAHLAMEQGDQAAAAFSQMIAADSSEIDGYYWLMNTLAAQKKPESIPVIFAAMQRNVPADSDPSKMATAYYFNGIAKFTAKEYKDAIASLEKATELKPDYAQAYLYIAVSYHSLKDKANACTYYRKTLQYDPENSTALNNLKKLGC